MINSVASAIAAFPHLEWRSAPTERGSIAFVICGGDRATGDNTILLAMEYGAQASLHRHKPRSGSLFRESITCLAGELWGVDPDNSGFILVAGRSIDLNDDTPHQPYVLTDGFALVLYRQPAGHTLVEQP